MTPITPAMDPAGQTPPEEVDNGGITICIHVAADGSLSVGLEGDQAPAPMDGEMGAEDEAPGAMKPAEDIKAALTEALRLYKEHGTDGQAQFEGGYADQIAAASSGGGLRRG